MSAFKNLLHSDTPVPGGNTGRISGQGSHFPSQDDPSVHDSSYAATGSTAPGVQPPVADATETSAIPSSYTQARDTTGPEVGGTKHVGTTSSTGPDTLTGSSSYQQPSQTFAAPSAQGNTSSMSSGGQEFPSVAGSTDGSGHAAIGETTTYSSARLAKGDPTGSVVDRDSANPMTFKQPERGLGGSASYTAGETGVTSGAAAAAASTAYRSSEERGERMPGEFPTSGYENPYKASRPLDPRVDGGRGGTADLTASQSSPSSRNTATGAAVGAGAAGAAALGATQAYSSHQHPASDAQGATGQAPSTLTSTADPTNRSATYDQSTQLKGLGDGTTTGTGNEESEKPGMVGKVLGAIGLGGAAGGAAAAIGLGSKKGDEKAVDTTTSSQETGPPKHYRRESIPTTAYPHGKLDSVPAVAPPVGGAQPESTSVDESADTKGRGAGLAAAGVGAGAAAAVTGGAVAAAHRGEQSRNLADTTSPEHPATTQSSSTAPQGESLVSSLARENEQNRSQNAGVAAAGVGAGAGLAGGAVAAHEHSQPRDLAQSTPVQAGRAEPQTGEPGLVHDTSGVSSQQQSASQGLKDSSVTQDSTIHDQTTMPSHVGRDTAIAGGAAAAIGTGAYAAHEHTSHQGSTAAPAIPERARDHTTGDGPPIDAIAAAPGRLDAQEYSREEDHTARNTALGAGAGAATVGGVAYEATKHNRESQDSTPSKEKKPSILKRIFKRRKNSKTGEEEEYSSEEEDSSGSHVPRHHSDSKGRNVLGSGKTYEEVSGGVQKPSYNPFKSDQPVGTAVEPHKFTETGAGQEKPIDSTTGLPYDPRHDPEAARRLSHDPQADPTQVRGTDAAPPGGIGGGNLGGTGVESHTFTETGAGHEKPIDRTTGLPYDPRHDPAAARRLSNDPQADLTQVRGTDAAPPGGSIGSDAAESGMKSSGARRLSASGKIKEALGFGKPSADHGDQNTRKGL